MRRKILALMASVALFATPLATYASKAEPAGSKKTASKSAAVKKPQASKTVASKGKRPEKARQASRAGSASRQAARKVATAPNLQARKAVATQVPRAAVRPVEFHDDPSRLAIQSSSAIVIDQNTGKALVEKQSDAIVPIASITKLMTAMVVLDAGLDLQEVITISNDDIDTLKGSRSRLPVGATMTRETAMLLALMSSENRAANALGRHYPGGLKAFVQAMNRKSKALGMLDSRFDEPTGLSSNNVSTAHDLALMVAAAARYPEIRMYSTTAEAKLELHGRLHTFNNTNALVRSDTWQIGVSKTGYISEAGRCLVMQARVADKPVVIVLLDSQGKMTRVGDANRIKRWIESARLAAANKPV